VKPGRLSIAVDRIEIVTFFKRDELTTDLVCCEIVLRGESGNISCFFHEEAPEWSEALTLIEQLPGFDKEWRNKVILPPYKENRAIAFRRQTLRHNP
jgi:hypothetical protein